MAAQFAIQFLGEFNDLSGNCAYQAYLLFIDIYAIENHTPGKNDRKKSLFMVLLLKSTITSNSSKSIKVKDCSLKICT